MTFPLKLCQYVIYMCTYTKYWWFTSLTNWQNLHIMPSIIPLHWQVSLWNARRIRPSSHFGYSWMSQWMCNFVITMWFWARLVLRRSNVPFLEAAAAYLLRHEKDFLSIERHLKSNGNKISEHTNTDNQFSFVKPFPAHFCTFSKIVRIDLNSQSAYRTSNHVQSPFWWADCIGL